MGIIFREFFGDASQLYKQTRQEFFEMRCCSLDKRDIDYHYRGMSFRYHALGGINDETLRQVYMNSLPTKPQGELQHLIELSGRSLRDISLGEIHMFTRTTLDKLCATQRVFAKMIREGRKNQPQKKKNFSNPKRNRKYKYYRKKAQYQWIILPFGLKTAPSLFQKAITRIFCPILHSALLYIDDIILFSLDKESHDRLLKQFHQIIDKYGIMLSDKKSSIGVTEIEFLGMKINDGSYVPGPHMVKQLLAFPDSNLSQKQTDASDHFWGVIIFEESNGRRHYCGHASGQFKDAQKHYHTIYKENLAVKNGISKFDFHLRTKNFIIEMDNSSFPKASSSSSPSASPPPPHFPPKFMATLPPGQLLSVQQVQDFTKRLTRGLCEALDSDDEYHATCNLSSP
ncbi:hypothetical protein Ddye_031893 [Dipteronia dyeriana]|uniref:Reverse transcriptase domain-containing protein n=1 Tax=Dipteronia dyeriana TaxID=168575 RepID=A0AAD9TJU5_9ROSI|nr:hypothetical protein Ddye_031893 [Dipteronia dyeriana]